MVKTGKPIRVGIMQPYFLPYMGYFQLIQKCDVFVLYDDIQFTKKGWISRNYLGNNDNLPWSVSLPTLASKTDTLIRDKVIAFEYKPDSILSRIDNEYGSSFRDHKAESELLQLILKNEEKNLFSFLKYSLMETVKFLNLDSTQLVISSEIGDFTHLKGESKVLAILKELNASSYLNPISGQHLYNSDHFEANGILLEFLEPLIPVSSKFDGQALSIFHSLLTQGTEKTIEGVLLGGISCGN
jgi:hypothetical protein